MPNLDGSGNCAQFESRLRSPSDTQAGLQIGHANFRPELGVGPSVTMGNAAKVLHQRLQVGEKAVETDVMLITTASVYPGVMTHLKRGLQSSLS